jgi:hypothetical protein
MRVREMPSSMSPVQFHRMTFAFDRSKRGWDPTVAAFVAVALHPMESPVKRRLEKAIRNESSRFASEIRDFDEQDAVVAGVGAILAYIKLSAQLGPSPDEAFWREAVDRIVAYREEMVAMEDDAWAEDLALERRRDR